MNKKGIYTIITTFFFIIIILIVAIGLIFYGTTITNLNTSANENMNKFMTARNFRDTLYFCFGRTLDENLLTTKKCLTGQNLIYESGLIKGYKITRTDVNNCTIQEWKSASITDYDDSYIYSVPITQGDNQVCLGKMEIYI